MVSRKEPNKSQIKNWLAFYNMIPSLFWSILNIVPGFIYCYNNVEIKLLLLISALSILPVFLRRSVLNKIQLSKSTGIYRKLGVEYINRFTQNGVMVNRSMKKKFPQYKALSYKRSSIAGLINQTYVFEKFHWFACVFFFMVTINALLQEQFVWSFVILINNIVYNIYPNLLQQYIRLRLKLFARK